MTALIHLLEEEGQPELLIWYKSTTLIVWKLIRQVSHKTWANKTMHSQRPPKSRDSVIPHRRVAASQDLEPYSAASASNFLRPHFLRETFLPPPQTIVFELGQHLLLPIPFIRLFNYIPTKSRNCFIPMQFIVS